MTRLLTPNIATMTEMREPHKVLQKFNGEPVAILKNSSLVGYFVPAEALGEASNQLASVSDIMNIMAARKPVVEPVLDYLKDK